MTAKTQKVELCAECRLDGGWHYDEDGNPSRPHHDAARLASDPAAERDAAIAATSEANPNAKHAALLIITDTARRHELFSANTCRIEMGAAQVPGPVVGAAFGQAVRDGIIRRDGFVPSSLGNTHGHEIKQWRSLIYRSVAS